MAGVVIASRRRLDRVRAWAAFGGGLIGVPVVVGGVLLFALAHLMPRRTAQGRELYRRSLGFRLYMTKAEKERQQFAEKANLFEEYLPYAIVYGCVDKWAKAFEGLGLGEPSVDVVRGPARLRALAFRQQPRRFLLERIGRDGIDAGRFRRERVRRWRGIGRWRRRRWRRQLVARRIAPASCRLRAGSGRL